MKEHIEIGFQTYEELNDVVGKILWKDYKSDVPSAKRDYDNVSDSFSNRLVIYNNNNKMWEIVLKILNYKYKTK